MVAFTILIILVILVGIFMTAAILMQNPKGGGLSGAFGGAGSSFGTMLGVRHASDILSKATWWLAGAFVALILIINLFFLPSGTVEESAIQRAAQEEPLQQMPVQGQPTAPTQGQPTAPPQGQAQPAPAQPAPQQTPPQGE